MPLATTTTQKLISIILVSSVGLGLIAVIMWYIKQNHDHIKQEVIADPVNVRGVIIQKRSYKGKDADVEYKVQGTVFTLKATVSQEFYRQHSEGDSVDITYLRGNPKKAVLTYELKQ